TRRKVEAQWRIGDGIEPISQQPQFPGRRAVPQASQRQIPTEIDCGWIGTSPRSHRHDFPITWRHGSVDWHLITVPRTAVPAVLSARFARLAAIQDAIRSNLNVPSFGHADTAVPIVIVFAVP